MPMYSDRRATPAEDSYKRLSIRPRPELPVGGESFFAFGAICLYCVCFLYGFHADFVDIGRRYDKMLIDS